MKTKEQIIQETFQELSKKTKLTKNLNLFLIIVLVFVLLNASIRENHFVLFGVIFAVFVPIYLLVLLKEYIQKNLLHQKLNKEKTKLDQLNKQLDIPNNTISAQDQQKLESLQESVLILETKMTFSWLLGLLFF